MTNKRKIVMITTFLTCRAQTSRIIFKIHTDVKELWVVGSIHSQEFTPKIQPLKYLYNPPSLYPRSTIHAIHAILIERMENIKKRRKIINFFFSVFFYSFLFCFNNFPSHYLSLSLFSFFFQFS